MPIPVTCPKCQTAYRAPDEAAGKAVKCKKCGERIPVPAGGDEEENPFKTGNGDAGDAGESAGDSGGDTKPPKKKAGSNKMLLIIGGVVLFLGCCCIVPGGTGGLGWYLGWFGGTNMVVVKDKDANLFKDDPFKDKLKDAFKDAFKDATKKK